MLSSRLRDPLAPARGPLPSSRAFQQARACGSEGRRCGWGRGVGVGSGSGPEGAGDDLGLLR